MPHEDEAVVVVAVVVGCNHGLAPKDDALVVVVEKADAVGRAPLLQEGMGCEANSTQPMAVMLRQTKLKFKKQAFVCSRSSLNALERSLAASIC